ncbi:retrovirus-related pol polyprotein from transposon TNT 1-94 [Tanacetum coccineum]
MSVNGGGPPLTTAGPPVNDTMTDMNISANDAPAEQAPAEQAPAIAPPTRMDDQILPQSMDGAVFNLHKDILIDELDITPINNDNPFMAPTSSDTVLEYVNTLGYLRKNSGYGHAMTSCVQMLWGLYSASNIDYAEWIWLEEIFGMPIPDTLLTDTIKRAPYYNGYLEHVAEYQRYLDEEHDKADDKTPKPTSSQPSKPTPTPTEPSQKDQGKKRKLVKETSDVPSPAKRSKAGKVTKKRVPKSPLKLIDEPSDEGVRVEEPAYNEEEANLQRALELSLKEQGERTQGPARPVVLREPDSGRIQPLPDVQGKGKEKVVDEQAAHDLLTLQTPKKKSPADQFIFQRRTPMPTEASGHAESPSLDAELALTDSEMESDNKVPKINTGDQDEGQAGLNPSNQDEGQVGLNPGDAAESQPQSSHENLKLPTEDQVILEEPASSSGTLSSLQHLEKDLSFTDQFFMEKPQEEEPGKTNAEAEV